MIGTDPRPGEDHIRRTREVHAIMLPALREVARRNGYALAVHGSLERDIDLLACPWRDAPSSPESLAQDIYRAIEAVLGFACGPAGWTEREKFPPPSGSLPNPTKKPHGRVAWSINVSGTYFDLSVMPPIVDPPKEEKKRDRRR